MPANELVCPACSSRLPRPASLRDGDLFECPMCATEWRIGSGAGQFSAKRPPGRSAVQTLDELEELDDEPGEELEVIEDEGRRGRRKRKRRKPGVVELGNWIRLGFLHWMPMLPPSIGFCIVYFLLYIVASLVFGLLLFIPVFGLFLFPLCLLTVMVSWGAGMTLVSIQQLKGRRWAFGDFFGATQWWMPVFLNWIMQMVIYVFLVVAPSAVVGYVMNVVGLQLGLLETLASLVGTLVFVLVYPLVWMFSWQLILDGNYGPVEAITENIQMTLPKYWKLLLLGMLTLGIRGVGSMLCGVGIVVAWPLAVLIESAAYLRLTGQRVVEKASEMN